MIYKTKPRPYQKDVVEAVLDKDMHYWMLNADPGLGKTKISIDIAMALYLQGKITSVWILAPNNVHRQWIEEQFPTHADPSQYTAYLYDSQTYDRKYAEEARTACEKAPNLRVYAFNIETLASESGVARMREIFSTIDPKKAFLIIDESSRIKTPNAKRSKTVHAMANAFAYRTTLTGTPVTQSPFDLWSQFEALKKNYFGINYYSFRHRYGLMIKKTMGQGMFDALMRENDFRVVRNDLERGLEPNDISLKRGIPTSAVLWIGQHPNQVSPYQNLDELKARIEPVTFVIRKEDVAKDLPEKIYAPIYTNLTPEQKRAYKKLEAEYTATYKGQELTLTIALSLTIRLQQITGGFFPYNEGETPIPFDENPKLRILIDDLAETDGRSIIIWAQFRAEIDAIKEAIAFEYPDWIAEKYYGGMSTAAKKDIEDRFKAGEVNVLIAHPKSAGIGLNLQVSNLHYIYSNGFSVDDRIQLEDRSHRIGQTRSVTYKDVYIKGTVDDKIQKAFRERRNVLDFFRGTVTIDELLGE